MKNDRAIRDMGWFLGAFGAGAAAMYLFDPDRGRKRRAMLQDRAVHLGKEASNAVRQSAYDASHRAKGLAANVRNVYQAGPVDDGILEARVRSRMGHFISHPHAVDVVVDHGVVTLFGPVLESEHRLLLEAVLAVKGIREVRDRVTTHRYAGAISSLQGGKSVPSLMLEPASPRFSPMGRMLVATAGAALTVYGARRKGVAGTLAGAVGAGLITSAIANQGLRESLGIKNKDHGYVVERSVRIHAPLSDIFRFWADPTNYPKVFPHIKNVERLEENLYRWTVAGPGDTTVTWDGQLVDVQPNKLIAWTTTPDSQVRNSGVLRFEPVYDGSTSLHVRLIYRPPAAIIGAFIADMTDACPRRTLEKDLARCKNFFEKQGRPRANVSAIDQIERSEPVSNAHETELIAGT
jgi:uncharacterized membrane protein